MSVFWKGDMPLGQDGMEYGSDGDFAHGHIKVNYWRDRAVVIAQIDARIAEMRAAMIGEIDAGGSCPKCGGRVRDADDGPYRACVDCGYITDSDPGYA